MRLSKKDRADLLWALETSISNQVAFRNSWHSGVVGQNSPQPIIDMRVKQIGGDIERLREIKERLEK